MLTHELARGIAHRRAAQRAHIEIVEHDDVDAPVERLAVRACVGRDRPALDDDLVRLLDRNVHERERIDLLRLAVFEHREVVARQARHELALLVSDDDVDVDVVDFDLEGHAGGLLSLPQNDRGLQNNDRTEKGERGGISHVGKNLFIFGRNLSIYGSNRWVRQA